jgi:hydrogenase expression/formation protein HypC
MCLGDIVRLDTVSGAAGVGHVGEREVPVSLVTLDEPVAAGDWVVVHSGFALQRLDPAEAAEALSIRGGDPSTPTSTPTIPTTPVQEKA